MCLNGLNNQYLINELKRYLFSFVGRDISGQYLGFVEKLCALSQITLEIQ